MNNLDIWGTRCEQMPVFDARLLQFPLSGKRKNLESQRFSLDNMGREKQ